MKEWPFKIDALYLCSAVVKPEFRRKGLALEGFTKIINKSSGDKRRVLFYWDYTPKGKLLADKIAKKTNLELRKRL